MSNSKIASSSVVQDQLRSDLPEFKVGSIISVFYKIIEGTKQRIQVFKGIVTNIKGGKSIDSTFTVNRVSVGNVKVERTFPFHSQNIEKIEIETLQRARSSNLNNLAFEQKNLSKSVRAKTVKAKAVVDK
jgi:large subunit ribosomal protein L19